MITFVQERKTERALDALRGLVEPHRGGRRRTIPAREVVVDDVIVLDEGDRVVADAVVLGGEGLAADESLLTGESVPVRKVAWDGTLASQPPGGDDLPFVFSGTLVVRGHAVARVIAAGAATRLGAIGKALGAVVVEPTRLQREVTRIVRVVAASGLVLCLVVTVVHGARTGDAVLGLLAGLTLAMALVPEDFPVVLTIFQARGAWRMSRRHVLARRVATVEMLGATTVLCVDKTGTLTRNQMDIARLWGDGCHEDVDAPTVALPEALHPLIEFGILASQPDPTDPMDQAFARLGSRALARTEHLHGDWELVREYPLSPDLLAISQVWRARTGDDLVVAAKGAPEAIIDLCHLDAGRAAAIAAEVAAMADAGLRVLGVARGRRRGEPLPGLQHDFDFDFVGMVGLADPVRDGVPAAIAECRSAGVRVVVITGDHPTTARSIARTIGLAHPNTVVTGAELLAMDDAEASRRVGEVDVFARMVPEQKLRLVEALKAAGEVVAMTGDGVNDAPALKAAHIGIAMGGRGTEVAREAAALVLLDDDFSSIVRGIAEGRAIFERLRRAVTFIVAIHVPIAGLSLLPVLGGLPLVLMPVHILFLELIIGPACSIVFEAEPAEADTMRQPPRDPRRPLFGWAELGRGLLQGSAILVTASAIYLWSWWRWQDADEARGLAFTMLILANLGLILTNRWWSRSALACLRVRNPALWVVVGGALAVLAAVLGIPAVRRLFHLALLHPPDLAMCAAGAMVSVIWFEAFKWWRRRCANHVRQEDTARRTADQSAAR